MEKEKWLDRTTTHSNLDNLLAMTLCVVVGVVLFLVATGNDPVALADCRKEVSLLSENEDIKEIYLQLVKEKENYIKVLDTVCQSKGYTNSGFCYHCTNKNAPMCCHNNYCVGFAEAFSKGQGNETSGSSGGVIRNKQTNLSGDIIAS